MTEQHAAPQPTGEHAAALAAPEKAGPDIMTFVLPILRSWFLIGVLAGVGVVGGVVFSLTKPNEYTSVGKIQILGSRTPVDMGGEIIDPTFVNSLQSWKTIYTAPEVSRKVAEIVGPHEILMPYDPASEDLEKKSPMMQKVHEFQSWYFGRNRASASTEVQGTTEGLIEAAAKTIKGKIEIHPQGYTDIMVFSYTSHNKKLAQRVVEAYIEVCKQKELELNQQQKSIEAMQKQESEQQAEAVAAEVALDEFKDKHKIHDFELQLIKRIEERNELRKTLENLDSDVKFYDGQLLAIETELQTTEEFIEKELPRQRSENLEFLDLRNDLQWARRAFKEVSSQFKPGTFEYDEAKAELEQIETKLKDTPRYVYEDAIIESTRNTRYDDLKRRLQDAKDKKLELSARADHRRPRLAPLELRVEELFRCQDALEVMETDADSKRARADATTAALQQNELREELDKLRITRLRVVHQANLPSEKSGPKRMKFVLAGLAAGMFAGIGFASLRGFLDRTVRRPVDLEDKLGVKVLGVVPYTSGWKRARRAAQNIPNDRMTTHV